MRPCHPIIALVCLLRLLTIAACDRHEAHEAEQPAMREDVHVAPHGGLLVELGDHAANLEIVHDADAGRLTVYVLGPHAENAVRLAQPAIEATVSIGGGEPIPLRLVAVMSVLTGETVGDSSQFAAEADALKTDAPVQVDIARLEVRGAVYENISVQAVK